MLWPNGSTIRPSITSPFGPRRAPVAGASTFHRGCDFVGFTLVRAIVDGVVERVGTPPGWAGGGIQVWVRHYDGSLSRYMHLRSATVRIGQRVHAGDELGVMGATGNVSGVHLHLEVVIDGAQIDPVPYITARLSGTPAGSGDGTTTVPEEDEMTPEQANQLSAVYAALFGPQNVGIGEVRWENADGARSAAYGIYDVLLHNQNLIAALTGQVAELAKQVEQLKTNS